MSSFLAPNNCTIDRELAFRIRAQYGTPVYVYDETTLIQNAEATLAFPSRFGLTVRFAMKACPNAAILQIFDKRGLHFDASSGFEVKRAILAGIPPSKISLSSQEFPDDFNELYPLGIEFNACSLWQLERFGQMFPGGSCGIRFNPGLGSGGTEKTNVGGPSSSFGVWHELQNDVKAMAARYGVCIKRIHTHIGSGSDPSVWQRAAGLSLALVEQFPDVTVLNLGGGFKVARVQEEVATDLQVIGAQVRDEIADFEARTGRALHFEIEPGTYLTANAGYLLCSVQDLTTTGEQGHSYIKIDAGMTEVLRPSLYGACHPISVLSQDSSLSCSAQDPQEYIVVGHCCESGDLLSCAPGNPDVLLRRTLPAARIGDVLIVSGCGAYCSSMSTKNYNSFPEAAEVLVDRSGQCHLIRRRQTLEQIIQNEVLYFSS